MPVTSTRLRLAEFILRDIEAILTEWEAFAATQLPAATNMGRLELRDHGPQILRAVAKDLGTEQTRAAQIAKSRSLAPRTFDAPETAAETHAVLRANSGFEIIQLTAEYRALRASVLRLWKDACPRPESTDIDDMIRFNEAIDQALSESVVFFSAQVEQARNLLLGVLGHDMRSPLHTILVTAKYLAALQAGQPVSDAAARLIRSGGQMQSLLDDLLDFNRNKLGFGFNVAVAELDAAMLFQDEMNRLQATHPQRRLELQLVGDGRGVWDRSRLLQLFDNLVLNALHHGGQDSPVMVKLTGAPDEVWLEVRNEGPAIDEPTMQHLFDPLTRGRHADKRHREGAQHDGSLGLGLYIARQIVLSHGGSLDVRSDATETVFTVRLPRRR